LLIAHSDWAAHPPASTSEQPALAQQAWSYGRDTASPASGEEVDVEDVRQVADWTRWTIPVTTRYPPSATRNTTTIGRR